MGLFKPNKEKSIKDTAEKSRFAEGGSAVSEQSEKTVFYECPKCYGGPLLRDAEQTWHCYRCGFSWDIDKRGRVRGIAVNENYVDNVSLIDILAEKMRRDLSEKLITLRKYFDTFRELGADVPRPKLPDDTKNDSITIHGHELPLIVDPSETRVPDNCPVCSNTDLARDERFVWQCSCGARFYYTDRRADPYTANSHRELELLCGFYAKNESLLLEGKEPDSSLPKSEIDALKQFLNT